MPAEYIMKDQMHALVSLQRRTSREKLFLAELKDIPFVAHKKARVRVKIGTAAARWTNRGREIASWGKKSMSTLRCKQKTWHFD